MKMTLRPEQREAVERMAAEPTRATLLAAETGVGKTVMSVEVAKSLGAQTVLIIAPLNTEDGWKKTFDVQGAGLKFRKIDSKTPENFDLLKAKEPGVYFVGREYFAISGSNSKNTYLMVEGSKKERFIDENGNFVILREGRKARWSWSKVTPDLAVFDEVQGASNRNSLTFKVLKNLRPKYKIAASATPQGNKFEGIWAPCRWLWPETTDRSFWRWVAEWGTTDYNPHSESKKKITGERVPGAYVKTLPCYVRLEADRVPEVKRKCYIDLTPSQRVMYDEMERDALTWLEENPLVADIPIVKRIRLRQIGLGEVTFNSKGEVDFEIGCRSGKIDALHKIVALHPDQPMLILLDSAKFVKVIVDALGPGAVPWTGDTKPGDRAKYKAEFGKSVKYIVATIPAIGEGTDGLQLTCHIEVWFNKSTNNMKNEQAAGRLNRGGQPGEVIYSYELLARGTDDDGQFEKLKAQTIANRKTLTI